jgi:hypothetical protein
LGIICSSIRGLRSISTRSGIVGCVGARSRLISRGIRARRGVRPITRRRVLGLCRVLRELGCDTAGKCGETSILIGPR